MRPMKQIITLAIAFAIGCLFTSCKSKTSGEIQADWKPDESLRVVDGQTYDTTDSASWGSPLELNGPLPRVAANGHPVRYQLVAETIQQNTVVAEICAVTYWFETWTGQPQDESRDTVKTVVILNYPFPEKIISGQPFTCRCMRVKNFHQDGISYETYDCGTPSSSPVPMVNGKRIKIDGVQVSLINRQEADDFLQKKRSDVDQQYNEIKTNLDNLQQEIEDLTAIINGKNQSYTNDPEYVAVIKESDDTIKKAQALANAIANLRAKYGDSPYSRNMPLARKYPQAYVDAWHTEDTYAAQLREIQRNASHVDGKIDSAASSIKNRASEKQRADVEQARKDAELLKQFQSPRFYLADFSPSALETALTDSKGTFTFTHPQPGSKVLVKLRTETGQTNEEFFWLVDLPPDGSRLILNNQNLFTVPSS